MNQILKSPPEVASAGEWQRSSNDSGDELRSDAPRHGVIAWLGQMLVFEWTHGELSARFLGDDSTTAICPALAAAILSDTEHQLMKSGMRVRPPQSG